MAGASGALVLSGGALASGSARPTWTSANAVANAALSAREPRRVDDLVSQAQATLDHLQREARHDVESFEAKRERMRALITSAMEVLEELDSKEHRDALESALQAATKAQLLPELRVKGRKLLERFQRRENKASVSESEVRRLMRLLEASTASAASSNGAGGGGDSADEEDEEPPPLITKAQEMQRRMREQNLAKQLEQALAEAKSRAADQDLVRAAEELLRRVERGRRAVEKAEVRLRQLRLMTDPGELAEHLELERDRCRNLGPWLWSLLDELQVQLISTSRQGRHQAWLNVELEIATKNCDDMRLQQLVRQARTLDLVVPPQVLALLHSLQASERSEASKPKVRVTNKDPLERMRTFANRQKAKAEIHVAEAEEEPTAEDLRDARQAIVIAKQTRVPEEDLVAMEKRLAAVEAEFGPRFEVEEQLQNLMRVAAQRCTVIEVLPSAAELTEPAAIQELRELLKRAEEVRADPDIVCEAGDLLQRSLDGKALRAEAQVLLRQATERPVRTEAEEDFLAEAVEQAKHAGISTFQAEKELGRARGVRRQREAAEAALSEASAEGVGPKARRKLEDAIRTAKNVGVAAEKVQEANARMEELAEHERRCRLLAGDVRRALPLLQKEPWRLQGLVEAAKPLQPWPPELARLLFSADERVRNTVQTHSLKAEIESDMTSVMKRIKAALAGGQSCSVEDASALLQLVDRARSHGDCKEELLQEAAKLLSGLRRERCQREVADHRLHLALKAKDMAEIERAMRQVRALSHVADGGGGSGIGGGKAEAPHSARLMEAASSMLRQMNDSTAKRQAALSTLQERLSEPPCALLQAPESSPSAPPRPPQSQRTSQLRANSASVASAALPAGAPGGGGGAGGGGGGRTEKEWLAEVSALIQEARQAGAPPTVVEHAKLKVRERQRQNRSRMHACEALQQSLSKKDVTAQEVMHSLRRVQRFSDAPAQ